MAVVILGCAAMALIETLLEPPYLIKSGLKIAIFLLLPLLCLGSEGKTGFKTFFLPGKRGFRQSLFLGLSLYAFILSAFLLTKTTFDYGTIVEALAKDQGVSQENFIPVAAYISLGNSLLEEFFFRVVAFLKLRDYTGRWQAYIFSSCLFAMYHIAMIASSFPAPLILLALAGLAAGGAIFCRLNERNGDIYNSWMVHMFADLALMTIWLMTLTAQSAG